ncbi:MAG: 2'-5' RNA ligase family protein [Candidatus Pacebacteria bacterium]|nr:2'-5' RNA ligase family protein [Candidatus Paceibacterota bacterium]
MAQRYVIATPLPKHCVAKLDQMCIQMTGHPSPVHFHHVTIVSPFTIKNDSTIDDVTRAIKSIHFDVFMASFGNVGVFTQHDRKILHMEIEPAKIFEQLHKRYGSAIAPYVELDTSPFTSGVIPQYRAHTTIDYNAGNISSELIHQKFDEKWTVDSCNIYKEVAQGSWGIV